MPVHMCLEPGMEVHRLHNRHYPDVRQVAVDVAGRDVHRSAAGDAEMGEVAANPGPALEDIHCGGGGGAALLVPEMRVDPVADRLHPAPAQRYWAEEIPGGAGEQVGLAVAAGQGERDRLVRQVDHWRLRRAREHRIWMWGDLHQSVVGDPELALRDHRTSDSIVEPIAVLVYRCPRLDQTHLFAHALTFASRHTRKHHQRCGPCGRIVERAADPDKHTSRPSRGQHRPSPRRVGREPSAPR